MEATNNILKIFAIAAAYFDYFRVVEDTTDFYLIFTFTYC
jgi:hypothetical protein